MMGDVIEVTNLCRFCAEPLAKYEPATWINPQNGEAEIVRKKCLPESPPPEIRNNSYTQDD